MNFTTKLYPRSFYKDHTPSIQEGKLQATSIGLAGRVSKPERNLEGSESDSIPMLDSDIPKLFAKMRDDLAAQVDRWARLNPEEKAALRQKIVFFRYNTDIFGKFFYGKDLDLDLIQLERKIGVNYLDVTIQLVDGTIVVDGRVLESDSKLFEDLFNMLADSLVEGHEYNSIPLPNISKSQFERALKFFKNKDLENTEFETKLEEFQTAAQLMSVSYGVALIEYYGAKKDVDSLAHLCVSNPLFFYLCLDSSFADLDRGRIIQIAQKFMQSIKNASDPQLKEIFTKCLIQMINSLQITLLELDVKQIVNVLEDASDSALQTLKFLSTGIVVIDEGTHDRIANLIKRCQNIEELSLAGHGITPNLLDSANLPHLRTFEVMPMIKLPNRWFLPNEWIASLADIIPIFRDNTEFRDDRRALDKISSSLGITQFSLIGFAPFNTLIKYRNIPAIHHYSFTDTVTKLEDLSRDLEGFQSFDILSLKTQTILWPIITEEWIRKLLPFTTLRTLRLAGTNEVSIDCLDIIEQMTSLKELQLNCEALNTGLGNYPSRIGRMHNLESLVLFYGYIKNEQLVNFAEMPNLNSLAFSKCYELTDQGIANAGFKESCKIVFNPRFWDGDL